MAAVASGNRSYLDVSARCASLYYSVPSLCLMRSVFGPFCLFQPALDTFPILEVGVDFFLEKKYFIVMG